MLKALYNSLSLRERILLSAFIWIGLAIWAGALLKHFKAAKSVFLKTRSDLAMQQQWFDNEAKIESDLRKAMALVDPRKTYASSRLVGKLDTIARDSNLNFDINSPNTQTGEIFDTHTVRIQFKKAGLADLIRFDETLKKESPYIGLERAQIFANKSDPRFLDAQFLISSFELKNKSI